MRVNQSAVFRDTEWCGRNSNNNNQPEVWQVTNAECERIAVEAWWHSCCHQIMKRSLAVLSALCSFISTKTSWWGRTGGRKRDSFFFGFFFDFWILTNDLLMKASLEKFYLGSVLFMTYASPKGVIFCRQSRRWDIDFQKTPLALR